MDIELIRQTAKQEIEQELFRAAVDKEKERLKRKRNLWDILFPWKIIIIRKDYES